MPQRNFDDQVDFYLLNNYPPHPRPRESWVEEKNHTLDGKDFLLVSSFSSSAFVSFVQLSSSLRNPIVNHDNFSPRLLTLLREMAGLTNKILGNGK